MQVYIIPVSRCLVRIRHIHFLKNTQNEWYAWMKIIKTASAIIYMKYCRHIGQSCEFD